VSWSREFDDPIPLPRGRRLVTLQEAGNFITKLLKAEHEAAAEWQAAMEARIKGWSAELARANKANYMREAVPHPSTVPPSL
jgi:hypothetical protein